MARTKAVFSKTELFMVMAAVALCATVFTAGEGLPVPTS